MVSSELLISDDFLELNLWKFDMDLRASFDSSAIQLIHDSDVFFFQEE